MDNQCHVYRANITKVYDGDTVTADIDLGFGIWYGKQKIRLAGIDTPELRGPNHVAGRVARDFLRDRILDKEVILKTIVNTRNRDKQGKYGRYLGIIYLDDINMNELLVTYGHAVHKW